MSALNMAQNVYIEKLQEQVRIMKASLQSTERRRSLAAAERDKLDQTVANLKRELAARDRTIAELRSRT